MNRIEIIVETTEELNKIDKWLQDEVRLPGGNYSVDVFNEEESNTHFYRVKDNGYIYPDETECERWI